MASPPDSSSPPPTKANLGVSSQHSLRVPDFQTVSISGYIYERRKQYSISVSHVRECHTSENQPLAISHFTQPSEKYERSKPVVITPGRQRSRQFKGTGSRLDSRTDKPTSKSVTEKTLCCAHFLLVLIFGGLRRLQWRLHGRLLLHGIHFF